MPTRRIGMHVMEEALRLQHGCSRSQRETTRACGLSAEALNQVLERAARAVGLAVVGGLGQREIAGAAVRAPGRREVRQATLHVAAMA